jgi:hypothetical protein
MSLSWNPEKPAAPGWYWWKGEDDIEGEIIEVYLKTKDEWRELRAWLTRDESSYAVAAMHGKFAGPITGPT